MAWIVRRSNSANTGWNEGDLDLAFQLVQYGVVDEDELVSRSSRDHFLEKGFAIQYGLRLTLTPRGLIHFFTSRAVWMDAYRYWKMWKANPFVADEKSSRTRRVHALLS